MDLSSISIKKHCPSSRCQSDSDTFIGVVKEVRILQSVNEHPEIIKNTLKIDRF